MEKLKREEYLKVFANRNNESKKEKVKMISHVSLEAVHTHTHTSNSLENRKIINMIKSKKKDSDKT